MEPYSSGEELLIKTRKPYTITKQRERWTEEEHNKFLEAVKLYGRAWQRIEEHIGTKTAVQIRSHAQKFFTKLEKESFVKGVPIGHTLNINIPPPRPKRKPSNPYPRKTSVGVKDGRPSSPFSFLCQRQTTLDLEQEPLSEKSSDDRNNRKHADRELENDSAVFSVHETGACANSSSVNKILSELVLPKNLCTFREYVPLSMETNNQDEPTQDFDAKQLLTNQTCDKQLLQDDGSFNTSNIGNSYVSHEKYCHGNMIDKLNQSKNIDNWPTTNDDVLQNCLPHIPVHILEGSFGMNTQNVILDTAHTDSSHQKIGVFGPPRLFMNLDGSTTPDHHSNASSSSVHQSFPGFHPLSAAFQHQDDYQSFLHISSTFSNLLISALLQNQPAYAAASFAATLWPCIAMDTSGEFTTGTSKGLQAKQMAVPNMVTIAAATVAAATAWWAAHGLLPLCPPLHPGFTSTVPSTTSTPIDDNMRSENGDKKEDISDLSLEDQQLGPKCSVKFQEQHSALSSSCSEGIEDGKPNCGSAVAEPTPMADIVELLGSNKSNSRKQVDRSSCGSNTPSSSEEAEGKQEKDDEDKGSKEDEENHPSSDPFNRRCRSLGSINDPWKEVSEEGRLAFQALFSREILPQSFSRDLNIKRKKSSDMENIGQSQLNLNDQSRLENKEEESTTKACRTGFKPYKRCSVEAKNTRMLNNCKDEEKGPKRFRVGGIDKDST